MNLGNLRPLINDYLANFAGLHFCINDLTKYLQIIRRTYDNCIHARRLIIKSNQARRIFAATFGGHTALLLTLLVCTTVFHAQKGPRARYILEENIHALRLFISTYVDSDIGRVKGVLSY